MHILKLVFSAAAHVSVSVPLLFSLSLSLMNILCEGKLLSLIVVWTVVLELLWELWSFQKFEVRRELELAFKALKQKTSKAYLRPLWERAGYCGAWP